MIPISSRGAAGTTEYLVDSLERRLVKRGRWAPAPSSTTPPATCWPNWMNGATPARNTCGPTTRRLRRGKPARTRTDHGFSTLFGKGIHHRPAGAALPRRRAAIAPVIMLALATLGVAHETWAAPEPKVSVEFALTNGDQLLVAPAVLELSAEAFVRQQNHPIVRVEFYNGPTLVGSANSAPYVVAWGNVAAGSYSLTAKAINDKGDYAVSPAISVHVDARPTVSLTAPAANSVLTAPPQIMLAAEAADADGTIAKVDFFQGVTLIGTATAAPYGFVWSNPPPGNYSLTAVATDNLGASAISAPVSLIINAPPTVALTSPAPNQVVTAPANVTLTANATDADGTITKVEFYNGATLLGTATSAPYGFTWTNVPAGAYSLTAKATDNQGATSTSSPVSLLVDAPPAVTLTSPTAGAVAIAPASFTLTATATDSDGTIAKVEFFQGATLIGTATGAPYSFAWTNVAPGSYSLTAVATDNQGIPSTSAPVAVSVVANQPPSISLTSPTANQSFAVPATIQLTSQAADPDNNLAKVEFFQNGSLIATVLAPPYAYSWESVAAGSYQITAKATDALGAETSTVPITITVANPQPKLVYLHADHLNTPRLATDETGKVIWRNLPTTEPFGNSPVEEDPDNDGGAFTLNLRFPGQYFDRETNLNYNYFRDYDPSTGRYVQSDPIGLAGGINTYSYVRNSPLSLTDPYGLETYMCTQPLHALGGSGLKSGPDIPGNPFYHQYLCVSDGNGGLTCGGQDREAGAYGPGKPSDDRFKPQSCEKKEDDNKCIEQCVLAEFGQQRPTYWLFGDGRYGRPQNCQQWSNNVLLKCRNSCKGDPNKNPFSAGVKG